MNIPVMEKTRVAIASVLKPLKDSRAFYRIALSLRETNKYHLNIIGFSLKKESDQEGISFFSLFESKRTAFKRLFVGIKFLSLLIKIKPALIIVTTFELLLPAVLYKLAFGSKLIYDIQENYSLNLRHNQSARKFSKSVFLLLVNFIEFCSRPFIADYILAESCYKDEMPWIKNPVILENKFAKEIVAFPVKSFDKSQPIHFLITGTLTEVYGTLDALNWFVALVRLYPTAKLSVFGHVTIPAYGEKIREIAKGIPQVQLTLSDTPIAYEQILEAYEQADLVLLPYHQIPSISPKIPSKLYECLALGKPFLHSPNEKWSQIAAEHRAGFQVDFSDRSNIPQVIDRIINATFFERGIIKSAYWKAEEQEVLQQLIGHNLK